MKKLKILCIGLLAVIGLNSCFDDLDDVIRPATTLEIQDFVYKAMNIWYLYKPNVPDLANDRFATQGELNSYLSTFSSPEDLFYEGLVDDNVDRFSFIVEDYRILEAALAGISLSTGMEYGLIYYPGSETNVFGYVRYVVPNSDAATKGIERGMIFSGINGAQLTINNINLLSDLTTFDLDFATFDGTNITPNGVTITLVKTDINENPVHISRTITMEGIKIGYLMYNGFTGTYDSQLNAAFGNFKSDNVDELIIDLRYNGGGSVESAINMASMVTGQFAGQVFSTEMWNPELQTSIENEDPELLISRFTTNLRSDEAINSLNLSKVYILTTLRTASASELVINGLDPYIEVIQVGSNTTGKFQASTTLYDAPNFRRDDARLSHFYAIQPLIFTTANANGNTGFINGLPADVEIFEDYSNLGILGDINEPLLEAAINDIFGRSTSGLMSVYRKEIANSKSHLPIYERMYVDPDKLKGL